MFIKRILWIITKHIRFYINEDTGFVILSSRSKKHLTTARFWKHRYGRHGPDPRDGCRILHPRPRPGLSYWRLLLVPSCVLAARGAGWYITIKAAPIVHQQHVCGEPPRRWPASLPRSGCGSCTSCWLPRSGGCQGPTLILRSLVILLH